MSEHSELRQLADSFAVELTKTVRAVAPDTAPFRATSARDKVSVSQGDDEGIVLAAGGTPLLLLKVNQRYRLDTSRRFLAVDKSTIHVFAAVSPRQPIFRYEYDANSTSTPVSHLHVHGHRDALTFAMVKSGESTQRARRRHDADGIPSMQDLHFPLGGPRFRPCVEDVLEMLIEEFGIDHTPTARQALLQGRVAWREKQIRSVVRDDPQAAADVLQDLGYDIRLPPDRATPSPNIDRLSAY